MPISSDNSPFAKKQIITKDFANSNSEKIISPLIFTKKIQLRTHEGKLQQQVLIFEELLDCVVKAYYDKKFKKRNLQQELKAELDEDYIEEPEVTVKRRGRKKKADKQKELAIARQKRIKKKRRNKIIESTEFDNKLILDYLVSPLKTDLVYG